MSPSEIEHQAHTLLCLMAKKHAGDWEQIHSEADAILLVALENLGLHELVEAYKKLERNFWYA